MKIVADRSVCIGAAVCSLTAPDLFDQDAEEGLVVVMVDDPRNSGLALAWDAVHLCPSGALSVIGDDGADGDG